MLACSDGLQCCSSTSCRHKKKCHFFTQGAWLPFSLLKWNWGLTDGPILYITSRFIVQGYCQHNFFKCTDCQHSKRGKIRGDSHWLDHTRTLPPCVTCFLLAVLCRAIRCIKHRKYRKFLTYLATELQNVESEMLHDLISLLGLDTSRASWLLLLLSCHKDCFFSKNLAKMCYNMSLEFLSRCYFWTKTQTDAVNSGEHEV